MRYAFTRGGLAFDPALPVTNPELNTANALLAYARVLDSWGMSGKIGAGVPNSWLSGSADFAGRPLERVVDGFADPRVQLSVNFFGAPAVSLDELRAYRQDLTLGASVQVSVPAGQYDASRVVNIGTGRWFIEPEVGVSKAFGPWTLEVSSAVIWFTDNDDFCGGKRRSQDPLYSIQAHLIYSLHSGIWASLNGTYSVGGRTALNDVQNDDRQELARRRHAGLSPERPRLAQVVCEQRRIGPHREQLRSHRDRLATPSGWWIMRLTGRPACILAACHRAARRASKSLVCETFRASSGTLRTPRRLHPPPPGHARAAGYGARRRRASPQT